MYIFSFTRDIFRIGLKRDLQEDDIYEVLNNCDSEKLGDLLEVEWQKETLKKHPSLTKVFIRLFGWEYLIIGLNQFVMNTILL